MYIRERKQMLTLLLSQPLSQTSRWQRPDTTQLNNNYTRGDMDHKLLNTHMIPIIRHARCKHQPHLPKTHRVNYEPRTSTLMYTRRVISPLTKTNGLRALHQTGDTGFSMRGGIGGSELIFFLRTTRCGQLHQTKFTQGMQSIFSLQSVTQFISTLTNGLGALHQETRGFQWEGRAKAFFFSAHYKMRTTSPNDIHTGNAEHFSLHSVTQRTTRQHAPQIPQSKRNQT